MKSNDAAADKSGGTDREPPRNPTTRQRAEVERDTDPAAARLSTRDAIRQCPAESDREQRARELLREALQLMEGER